MFYQRLTSLIYLLKLCNGLYQRNFKSWESIPFCAKLPNLGQQVAMLPRPTVIIVHYQLLKSTKSSVKSAQDVLICTDSKDKYIVIYMYHGPVFLKSNFSFTLNKQKTYYFDSIFKLFML